MENFLDKAIAAISLKKGIAVLWPARRCLS
jgi:hypothetical protein